MTRLPRNALSARVLNFLRGAEGGLRTTAEIIEAVYGDQENGGPEDAARMIYITIFRLRRKGFPIEGQGAGFCGYRFVPTLWEVPAEPERAAA